MERTEALISERVRHLLDERGISGSELARQTGWTQSYASRRVRTVKPVPWSLADLGHLAAVLDVPLADFIPAGRAA